MLVPNSSAQFSVVDNSYAPDGNNHMPRLITNTTTTASADVNAVTEWELNFTNIKNEDMPVIANPGAYVQIPVLTVCYFNKSTKKLYGALPGTNESKTYLPLGFMNKYNDLPDIYTSKNWSSNYANNGGSSITYSIPTGTTAYVASVNTVVFTWKYYGSNGKNTDSELLLMGTSKHNPNDGKLII